MNKIIGLILTVFFLNIVVFHFKHVPVLQDVFTNFNSKLCRPINEFERKNPKSAVNELVRTGGPYIQLGDNSSWSEIQNVKNYTKFEESPACAKDAIKVRIIDDENESDDTRDSDEYNYVLEEPSLLQICRLPDDEDDDNNGCATCEARDNLRSDEVYKETDEPFMTDFTDASERSNFFSIPYKKHTTVTCTTENTDTDVNAPQDSFRNILRREAKKLSDKAGRATKEFSARIKAEHEAFREELARKQQEEKVNLRSTSNNLSPEMNMVNEEVKKLKCFIEQQKRAELTQKEPTFTNNKEGPKKEAFDDDYEEDDPLHVAEETEINDHDLEISIATKQTVVSTMISQEESRNKTQKPSMAKDDFDCEKPVNPFQNVVMDDHLFSDVSKLTLTGMEPTKAQDTLTSAREDELDEDLPRLKFFTQLYKDPHESTKMSSEKLTSVKNEEATEVRRNSPGSSMMENEENNFCRSCQTYHQELKPNLTMGKDGRMYNEMSKLKLFTKGYEEPRKESNNLMRNRVREDSDNLQFFSDVYRESKKEPRKIERVRDEPKPKTKKMNSKFSSGAYRDSKNEADRWTKDDCVYQAARKYEMFSNVYEDGKKESRSSSNDDSRKGTLAKEATSRNWQSWRDDYNYGSSADNEAASEEQAAANDLEEY